MKLGLDIGNSKVKGAVLDDDNILTNVIGFPSAVNHINDKKYLTYPHDDDFYIQVLESPLKHYDDILAVGDRAMDMPDYEEYDVASTSYKTNHPMTTSMLFGAIATELLCANSIFFSHLLFLKKSANITCHLFQTLDPHQVFFFFFVIYCFYSNFRK